MFLPIFVICLISATSYAAQRECERYVKRGILPKVGAFVTTAALCFLPGCHSADNTTDDQAQTDPVSNFLELENNQGLKAQLPAYVSIYDIAGVWSQVSVQADRQIDPEATGSFSFPISDDSALDESVKAIFSGTQPELDAWLQSLARVVVLTNKQISIRLESGQRPNVPSGLQTRLDEEGNLELSVLTFFSPSKEARASGAKIESISYVIKYKK